VLVGLFSVREKSWASEKETAAFAEVRDAAKFAETKRAMRTRCGVDVFRF